MEIEFRLGGWVEPTETNGDEERREGEAARGRSSKKLFKFLFEISKTNAFNEAVSLSLGKVRREKTWSLDTGIRQQKERTTQGNMVNVRDRSTGCWKCSKILNTTL